MDTTQFAKKTLNKFNSVSKDYSWEKVAKTIEKETTSLSSELFLLAVLSCLGASAILRVVGLRSLGQFVGQVATPVLIMGLYSKILKS